MTTLSNEDDGSNANEKAAVHYHDCGRIVYQNKRNGPGGS